MPADLRLNHLRALVLSLLALAFAFMVPALTAQSPIFSGPRDYPVGTGTSDFVSWTIADFIGDGFLTLPSQTTDRTTSCACRIRMEHSSPR